MVRKGVPFREAHHIAGNIVSYSETNSIAIEKIPLEVLKAKSKYFDQDVTNIWNYKNSVEQYTVVGGTSRKSVLEQITEIYKLLDSRT